MADILHMAVSRQALAAIVHALLNGRLKSNGKAKAKFAVADIESIEASLDNIVVDVRGGTLELSFVAAPGEPPADQA